ncbi:MAG: TetR family transcriptional regulator [Gammaproteobacteria bacterium]|nr:MAG: TetR family transcriptional regulator [Gammaproteobacteria bacterium]
MQASTPKNTVQQSYHHGNLRQALLEKAQEQLTEVGPDKLSLRALARDVGVSQTAPYRHFADKTDLLAALSATGFRRLRDALMAEVEGLESAVDKLHISGKTYILFAQNNAELYRLMFGPMIPPDFDHRELQEAGNEAVTAIVGIIESGIQQGQFRADDPFVLANSAWGMVHGLASLLIDNRFSCTERPFLEEDVDKALRVVSAGLSC